MWRRRVIGLAVLAASAALHAQARAPVGGTMARRMQACAAGCHGKEGRATRDGYTAAGGTAACSTLPFPTRASSASPR